MVACDLVLSPTFPLWEAALAWTEGQKHELYVNRRAMSSTSAAHADNPEDDTTVSNEGALLAEDLVRRCKQLLGELEAFQQYLAHSQQGQNVEVKPFRNSVAAELKSLEKVGDVRSRSKMIFLLYSFLVKA